MDSRTKAVTQKLPLVSAAFASAETVCKVRVACLCCWQGNIIAHCPTPTHLLIGCGAVLRAVQDKVAATVDRVSQEAAGVQADAAASLATANSASTLADYGPSFYGNISATEVYIRNNIGPSIKRRDVLRELLPTVLSGIPPAAAALVLSVWGGGLEPHQR